MKLWKVINKMKTTPQQLKRLYENGHNISSLLRDEYNVNHNTQEIIEISYDMQAGSYVEAMNNKDIASHKSEYSKEIADTISTLTTPNSILEAGVGEGTTLSGVLKHLDKDINSYGFDISWSRLSYADLWLKSHNIKNTTLCSGDLFNIPFLDNSIDVVYTSHSIEPNGGNEKKILEELYRITGKYLILLEPSYELSSQEVKNRMDAHGYCKNIEKYSKELGYKILKHELFKYTDNPLNPTAITIISKSKENEFIGNVFACPKYKTPLLEVNGSYFSEEALVAYPIINKIPCLRIENGVFASKYIDNK